jgi:hypothetical protein
VLTAMIATIALCCLIDARKSGHLHAAVALPGIAIIAVNVATYVAQIHT